MKEELKKVLRYLTNDYVSFLVWIFTVLFTAMFLAGIEMAGLWLVITSIYIFGQIMVKGTLTDLYQMKIDKEKFYKKYHEMTRKGRSDGSNSPLIMGDPGNQVTGEGPGPTGLTGRKDPTGHSGMIEKDRDVSTNEC